MKTRRKARPAGRKARSFTVPEVWRKITKKNERQAGQLFDVLVCNHAVPANDNTYRVVRACPECRVSVQKYADEHPAHPKGREPAKRPPSPSRRKTLAA